MKHWCSRETCRLILIANVLV